MTPCEGSLVRYLNLVNKIPQKLQMLLCNTSKGTKFPVHKNVYAKIEKQNNIYISVFGYEGKTTNRIYTSKYYILSYLMYYYYQILRVPIML